VSDAAAIVARWARETEADLRTVFREAAQDVADNVSVGGAHAMGTPVKTGFARNSWHATLDGSTPGANGTAPSMALVIASADLADTVTISNSTEYLPYLEDGSTTPRAPFVSGWIASTVQAWPSIVALAARRLRRSP